MGRSDFSKERVILFTKAFLTQKKAFTVEDMINMFQRYSGEKVKRQTVYSDLNAISIVVPLVSETRGTSKKYWRAESVDS